MAVSKKTTWVPLLFLLSQAWLSVATLTVVEKIESDGELSGCQYDSMEAAFGMIFKDEVSYKANLIALTDLDEYFCDISNKKIEQIIGMFSHQQASSTIRGSSKVFSDTELFFTSASGALLIKRGKCSYKTKARNVMKYNIHLSVAASLQSKIKISEIQYAVIYDDEPRAYSKLELMTPDDGSTDDVNIGLQFISNIAGRDMLSRLKAFDALQIIMKSSPHVLNESNDISTVSWWKLYFIFLAFFFLVPVAYVLFFRKRHSSEQRGVDDDINNLISQLRETVMQNIAANKENSSKLSVKDVESFPDVEYDCENAIQKSCAICMEGYENGEQLKSLPCKHFFHTKCVTRWLTESQSRCPLCKAVVSIGAEDTDLPPNDDAVTHSNENQANSEIHPSSCGESVSDQSGDSVTDVGSSSDEQSHTAEISDTPDDDVRML